MSTANDWITNRVTQAKDDKPRLTRSVVTRMDNLLRDRLTRSLTQTELTTIAKQIIKDMIPPSPGTEAK